MGMYVQLHFASLDQNAKSEEIARFTESVWSDYVKKFDVDSFRDPVIKRRLQRMQLLGVAALSQEDLKRVSKKS